MIASISESPDGQHVLVNWFDQADSTTRAGVFDLDNGALLVSGMPVRDYAIFAAPGDIVGASDTRMERIDAASLEVLSSLPRAEGGSRHLAASRDGRTLLNVGFDGQARLYDLARGIPLADAISIDTSVLVTDETPIGAHLTADGKTLLTNSPAGVLAWDLRPKVQARAACEIAGREFTAEEWRTYFPGETQVATCAALTPR